MSFGFNLFYFMMCVVWMEILVWRYEVQIEYGSIGWSVGATLGYAQAAPEKRVVACIGDGSFQVYTPVYSYFFIGMWVIPQIITTTTTARCFIYLFHFSWIVCTSTPIHCFWKKQYTLLLSLLLYFLS